MFSKFSVSVVALATILTIANSSTSTAEVYKTSKGQVIITGLTAKQNYPVQVVNAKNKSKKLKDKSANTCGEVTVDNASTYKSLIVGTETINPTALTIKVHPRCNGKKTAALKKKIMVKTGTTTTIIPPVTVPTAIPTMAPAGK
jgi:predicted peptidase